VLPAHHAACGWRDVDPGVGCQAQQVDVHAR
jgi:hypothetical protein